MVKISICDDNKTIREQTKALICQYDSGELELEVYEDESAEALLVRYQTGFTADIIFLDIEMGQMDGIAAAKRIRATDRKMILIFISSYIQKVFDTFECETFNFIQKPIEQKRFDAVLSSALNKYRTIHTTILLERENSSINMPVENIFYVEVVRNNSLFVTKQGRHKIRMPLSNVLTKLEPYGFIQTHQGYVVNLNLVKCVDDCSFIMINGERVPVAVKSKTKVFKLFANYLEESRL